MATTVISSQKVENFAKWQLSFEAGEAMRSKAGIILKGIYQGVEDENPVTIISEVPSQDIAKAIFSSESMKEVMEKSGIITVNDVKILKSVN